MFVCIYLTLLGPNNNMRDLCFVMQDLSLWWVDSPVVAWGLSSCGAQA